MARKTRIFHPVLKDHGPNQPVIPGKEHQQDDQREGSYQDIQQR
jgi:hypothetical protein